MKLVSVNVGTPREIGVYKGKAVNSAIYKAPVAGPVKVGRYNLQGDRQANPGVHGGEDMAAYAYPSEHYEYWRRKFPEMKLDWGVFGENLTTEGLEESRVRVGDRILVGSAEFSVTKPRLPCYKLGIRFGTERMLGWFLESGFSGFYLRVLKEGQVQAGDAITLDEAAEPGETIAAIVKAAEAGSK
jgi:MOSC domain-containing protein YiiM